MGPGTAGSRGAEFESTILPTIPASVSSGCSSKFWPQGFGVIQNLFIRAVKRYLCPQMNELRLSLGLPRTASPDYSGAPPALDLALFSPVMGRSQPDWPANTVTTGYVFH